MSTPKKTTPSKFVARTAAAIRDAGQKPVIVYGPQGCGKTLRAEEMRQHFMLDRVVELDEVPKADRHNYSLGTLYLTSLTREEMVKQGLIDEDARRVLSFGEVMAQLADAAARKN